MLYLSYLTRVSSYLTRFGAQDDLEGGRIRGLACGSYCTLVLLDPTSLPAAQLDTLNVYTPPAEPAGDAAAAGAADAGKQDKGAKGKGAKAKKRAAEETDEEEEEEEQAPKAGKKAKAAGKKK